MRVKAGLARVRRAVTGFAVRYGVIGVSLLVAVIAVGIAGLTLTVAPENVKETWAQRIAIIIGGWSVAGGGIWLSDYLWHKIKGVHEVLSRKERELNRQEGREQGRTEGLAEGRVEGLAEGVVVGRNQGLTEGRQQGLDEGREEERREWQGWYRRMRQAAESGLPFEEPPPGGET